MQDANQMCILCNEAVTNPICPDCLTNAMEQWALMVKPSIMEELNNRASVFKAYTHDGTKCVICSSNINICSHCFSKEIYQWIQESHPELTENFLVCFNYELETPCRF